jgi:hypothetical protein
VSLPDVCSRHSNSPFFSMLWMVFSPFNVCVTWKSTAIRTDTPARAKDCSASK